MLADPARRSPRGRIALLVTLASLALGGAYYAYLVAVPFPPGAARIIPFIWLAGALAGLALALRATHADAHRLLGVACVVLGVPSLVLATIFAFAALMGG